MTAERYELVFNYAHKGLEGFDKATVGVRGMKSEMAGLVSLSERAALGAVRAGGAVGIFATATTLAVAGMAALVKAQADAARENEILAAKLGLSARQGHELKYSLDAAGVSTTVLESATRNLSTKNSEAQRVLKQLGIETTDVTGRQRAAGPVFLETALKLSKITNEYERSRAASRAFGAESAAALEGMLRSGKLLGPALDDGLTKNLEAARVKIAELDAEWGKFRAGLAGKIAPIIIPIIARITKAVSGSMEEATDAPPPDRVPFQTESLGLSPSGVIEQLISPWARGDARGQIEDDLALGKSLSASFARSQLNTASGLRLREAQLSGEIAQLSAELASSTINASQFGIKKRDFDSKSRELENVRDRLKALNADKRGFAGAMEFPFAVDPMKLLQGPLRENTPFVSSESDRFNADPVNGRFSVEQSTAFGEGLLQRNRFSQQSAIERAQTLLDLESRRVRLIAGPEGEEAAVRAIADLRLKSLEQQLAMGADIRDAELERVKIARETELELLELQTRRIERYKKFFGDAVFAGLTRDGNTNFFRAQFDALKAQVATNTGGLIYDRVGPILGKAIGGKDGSTGSPVLDSLLKDTLFDPKLGLDQQKIALDANTQSTIGNTQEMAQLRQVIANGGVGMAGAGALLGAAGSVSDIEVDSYGMPSTIWKGGGAKQPSKFQQSLSKGVGYAGIAAMGAVGVYSGLKQGGARGISSAIASGLGAAAMIPGPHAGFAAAGALIAGFLGTMLPDPKTKFAQEQAELLNSRRYLNRPGYDSFLDFGTGGLGAGTDILGRTRIVVQMTVNTLDADSFIRHQNKITDAVQSAVNRGHPFRTQIPDIVFGG